MQPSRSVIKYLLLGAGLLILLGVLLFFAKDQFRLAPEVKKPDTDLLARVGPHEIRAEQFRSEMARRRVRPKKLDKRALLEEMIDYETFVVKAIEAGLDKDPEFVRSYRNLLVGRFKQWNLTPRIEGVVITEEDITAHYEENADAYTRPAKVRLAFLYLKTTSMTSGGKRAALLARMTKAREKALNLKDVRGFGPLAITYSEDQVTRYKGGDIGWVQEGRKYRWNVEAIAAGFALGKPGDISDIITTDMGLFLVKLLDQRESAKTPLKKVRTRIRHKMLLERRKQTEKAFLEEMRDATQIEVFPDALANMPVPAASLPETERPPKMP